MKYKHILFDLDGTAMDTIRCLAVALNYTLEYFHYPYSYTDEETKKLVGHGTPYMLKHAIKDEEINDDRLNEMLEVYIPKQKETHQEFAEIFPDFKETLIKLKEHGIDVYIVTNKPQVIADYIVPKLYGKDFFKDIIGQDGTRPPKPNPEGIIEILNKYNLNRKDCLYVGDSIVDFHLSKNAGIDFYLVTYGYGFYEQIDETKVQRVISKPSELECILED